MSTKKNVGACAICKLSLVRHACEQNGQGLTGENDARVFGQKLGGNRLITNLQKIFSDENAPGNA